MMASNNSDTTRYTTEIFLQILNMFINICKRLYMNVYKCLYINIYKHLCINVYRQTFMEPSF